ncbi:uncharacterized protein METZ01_LOCUS435148, partial [marine metagenome]
AGWKLFGINEIWPRLVAPLFGLGCLIMTSLLGNRLYPRTPVRFTAPLLLIGCYYWALFTTLTMFDLIVVFWSLVGIYGLVLIRHTAPWRGWFLFGCATGLGILSKGPIILVFLLPSALLAPYWLKSEVNVSWLKWYTGILVSMIFGTCIALAWAIPAGNSGGIAYQEAILWGQSAGRIIRSFAHEKPLWWYTVILPGVLLPWLIWPSLLKRIWLLFDDYRNEHFKPDKGLRLMLVWTLPALVFLSFISGKQPHYLFPLFPALA